MLRFRLPLAARRSPPIFPVRMSFFSAPVSILFPSSFGQFPASNNPSNSREQSWASAVGAPPTDFVARYLLKKWGLQPDKDVPIFQAGAGPQVFAALKGGAVQSGVLSTGPKPCALKQRDTCGLPMFPHRVWFIRLDLSRPAKRFLKASPTW